MQHNHSLPLQLRRPGTAATCGRLMSRGPVRECTRQCTMCLGWCKERPTGRPTRNARTRMRRPAQMALFGKSEPLPAYSFSDQDLARIKRYGPRVDDLVLMNMRTEDDPLTGETSNRVTHAWVPLEILGERKYAPEPDWYSLPRMSFMEFYQGLRERNWMSEHFKPDSQPWQIQFFQDSGRLFRPAFAGYRALVKTGDGQLRWVSLEDPGLPAFTHDHMSGGTWGGIYKARRVQQPAVATWQYGYHQVFEQLFQAYERELPNEAHQEFYDTYGVVPDKYEYSCPGERLLDTSWHYTIPEVSFAFLFEDLPAYALLAASASWILVSVAIGMLRKGRSMPSDALQAIEFARSKGHARREGTTGIKFGDVAGLDSVKEDLQEVVDFLQDPKKGSVLNAKPPKGVLLEGDPGVGKTLIAKAIAGEAMVPFFQMAGSEFTEAIVGVGAARVRDLFRRARVNAPCLVFVDEIDSLGLMRSESGMVTDEEREQTLNQLLTEMDGFTPDTGVVFVAATNRADLLDSALLRPGRFDFKIHIPRPDTAAREAILKVHAANRPIGDDVDFAQVARDLPGLSGAELARVMNESALVAARQGSTTISSRDVYSAIDRILQGERQNALLAGLQVRRVMAVHEVGKALVAVLLRQRTGLVEAVERVSIVPRRKHWTRTIFLRGKDTDYLVTTRQRLQERLRVVMAGRAAEELAFGHASTYGVDDLKEAAHVAENIVADYCLSDSGITVHPAIDDAARQRQFETTIEDVDVSLYRSEDGDDAPFQPADDTILKMRLQQQRLMRDAFADALELLRAHRDALEVATFRVLQKEMLTGQELTEILEKYPAEQAAVAA